MSAASLLTINDGATGHVVPSTAMFTGSVSRSEVGTGSGVIEYATGNAKRWVRYEAWQLTISGNGPVPNGLIDLDFTATGWTVTVSSFENDTNKDEWTVIPARPQETRDLNTGRTSWSLTMRAAAAGGPGSQAT
jgi:hypothetical protein